VAGVPGTQMRENDRAEEVGGFTFAPEPAEGKLDGKNVTNDTLQARQRKHTAHVYSVLTGRLRVMVKQ
jgi:hypothetical protein